jgi:cytochrome P450
MIAMDPPDHDVLRALVSRVFTPRQVALLEPDIRSFARGYLDQVIEAGGGDFVTDFACLLPMDVIFTLLGVPAADRRLLRSWMDTSLERDQDDPGIPPRAMEASARMAGYWFEMVARLRVEPGDDFVSRLITVEIDTADGSTRRLTDAEVAGFCALIGAAGNETATKLLANAVVLLSRFPDERARVLADPALIAPALEETLRYWAPSQYQGRTAGREVSLHGRTIPAGDRVILVTGSANRDERVYDDADRFDVGRTSNVIGLGFGYGAHFCIGAALARMETRIALEEFLSRLPDYAIDEAGLQRVHMSNVHGFEHVPFQAKP